MPTEKKILNVYSIIVGVFFLLSGAGKVIDTKGFSQLIYQYGFDFLMVLSPLIVLIEILFGIMLILLIRPKLISILSTLMLVVFTIAFTYAHYNRGINDCGCFGSIQPSNTPFIISILRNVILIGMSAYIWARYPAENSEIKLWKKIVLVSVMSISIFVAGLSFEIPKNSLSQSTNHSFLNKHIKDTELSKFVQTSNDSTYAVFCFSYSCPHCMNSIQNFRHFKQTNTVDNIVAIVPDEKKGAETFNKNFQPDFPMKSIPLLDMQKLTEAYPTTFVIKNDTIKAVVIGELSSPIVFRNANKWLLNN